MRTPRGGSDSACRHPVHTKDMQVDPILQGTHFHNSPYEIEIPWNGINWLRLHTRRAGTVRRVTLKSRAFLNICPAEEKECVGGTKSGSRVVEQFYNTQS